MNTSNLDWQKIIICVNNIKLTRSGSLMKNYLWFFDEKLFFSNEMNVHHVDCFAWVECFFNKKENYKT